MHVRAHNPTPVWHYLVAAGLAGAGVTGIVMGRRAHAAEPTVRTADGNGNGNGAGNGEPAPFTAFVRDVYPPSGPQGWYATLMGNTARLTASCIQQGVRGTDNVKKCVLDSLFPLASWPPVTGQSHQWQYNVWSNRAFNEYIELALTNA